jgi:hypothetical protein
VVIGASAARVVVDTVAVVDVDDLDRSLPSIARVIFCKAEEKVSSRFCHFVRPPPLRRRKKKVHFFPFSFCARERKRNSSSDLPLSARARVSLLLLLFAFVFIIIERRECPAEEAKMLRT